MYLLIIIQQSSYYIISNKTLNTKGVFIFKVIFLESSQSSDFLILYGLLYSKVNIL